jgi:hypothetical protein
MVSVFEAISNTVTGYALIGVVILGLAGVYVFGLVVKYTIGFERLNQIATLIFVLSLLAWVLNSIL